MSQSRMEIKVGVFVLVGLLLLGALTVLFSSGRTFYRNTYELRLKSGDVGGIKTGAGVLLRGVKIGNVAGMKLDPDGRGVTIVLKIDIRQSLFNNARFEMEQSGFLGDRFIAIYPGESGGQRLANGDEVQAGVPFNIQEAVATTTATISKISQATTNLDAAVSDVRRLVLTEATLGKFGASLDRFATLTAEAQAAVSRLNALVASNALPVTEAVSNLNAFTAQLPPLASYVQSLVQSNAGELTTAIKNLETGSATFTNLLTDVQSGHGVAGRLLRDEEMAANVAAITRNLSITTSNLSVTTSNLNRGGLWGIMWSKKPTRSNPAAEPVESPRGAQ
ncbi:MAG: MCE family protein [Verrucomicrobia bacterium]|nr:MCE family protein [Verrucomicrobiota bacterium]